MGIVHTIPKQLWNTDHPAIRKDWLGPFTPNYINNKPEGAIWTSSAHRQPSGGYTSAWHDWCNENEWPRKDFNVLLIPKKTLTVYEIDNQEDFLALRATSQKPFRELTPHCASEKGVAYLASFQYHAIDFAYYAQNGLDGIHVTQNGLDACSIWAFGFDNTPAMGTLSCWDIESTCWFNMDWVESFQIL